MSSNRIMAVLAATALVLPPALAAQSKGGGFAIIPFAGYAIPGTFAKDDASDIQFEPNGALLLGVQAELGLSKTMGIDVGANQTFSQTIDFIQGGTSQAQQDLRMTQITGSLIIRPKGRKPNGSVTPLFIEIGGGVTMYHLCSASAGSNCNDFDATEPMGFVGAGYNLPIGPRATVQLFARAQYISAYSSKGLDDFNATPPVSDVQGQGMMNFQVGGALRVGR
jgi:hypothetical protein